MIDATAGAAGVYKANLAFFEALGAEGWALLERTRAAVPDGAFFIADAKRSDIGSTAERYAEAMFDRLRADACTINPLMGSDSLAPWLNRDDRLAFVLALTSNPGARDFLLPDDLYLGIIERTRDLAGETPVGFVVGATRGEQVSLCRTSAGDSPLLIPGLGAQGGSLEQTAAHARWEEGDPRVVIHLTRGLLPDPDDADPAAAIRARLAHWNDTINAAFAWEPRPSEPAP